VEERLANEPYVIFNRSSPDGIAVGCKFSSTYSLGKDLKEWYFVLEGLEKGVEAQVKGKSKPEVPGCVGAGGSTRRDSLLDCCLSKAEVTAETICVDGVQI